MATLRRRGRGAPKPGTRAAAPKRSWRERFDALTESMSSASLRRRGQELERRLGITRSGQIALIGAVGIWIIAYVVAGTAMYLFAYGAVALVGVSYLIAPRRLRLQGERAGLFPRIHEGDRLAVELKLQAGRRLTTFVLEERLPERLGKPVKVPITSLSSGTTVTHHYALRATRRGVYNVGPLVAVASDPLGLCRRETLIAEPFELLVHPQVEVVHDRPLTRQYEDPPMRPPVSKPWPSGLEFYGMRTYVPGDDLRRIVWRASARTGQIMVREAEQGITDKIVIILDTNRGVHSRDGEGLSESFEMGVRAAASLGIRHLRDGYQVTTLANKEPVTRSLRGPADQTMLLDALTRIEMDRAPLGDAILRLLSKPQRDAHHILITPHLGPTEAAQLKLFLRTGVSIMVVALLWKEGDVQTMGVAASLGCQVVGLRPGQDIATALLQEMGAGKRI